MTHADLRQRLRAYADGTLDEAVAELVRAHLASGCEGCLREVFTRPVGVSRAPIVIRRSPRGALVVAGIVAGIAAITAALVGRTAPRMGVREPSVEALVTEIDGLRAEHERGDAMARKRIARLEARLRERPKQSPGGANRSSSSGGEVPAPTPPETADAVPRWLGDLLSETGAHVVPLGPLTPAPGASGFAVWSPAHGVVVVSAANLPRGDDGAVYRVRVTMSDDSTVWIGDVAASERGTLLVAVAMPEPAGRRVTGVDLYRDPPGAPVLSARLRS